MVTTRLALFSTACVTFLTACGTVSQEHRALLQERTRTFSVQSLDSISKTPISNREIVSSLVESAYQSSKYNKAQRYYDGGYIRTKGVSVETDESLNMTVYYRDNFESLIKYKAGTFKISTAKDEKNTRVSVTCPSNIEIFDSFKTGQESDNIYSDQDVTSDITRICDGLKVVINKIKYVKGETNTQFPSDSVFANYARKLRQAKISEKDVKTYDIEKAKFFTYAHGNSNVDVAISVFPYRSGSKVVYGFKIPYSILGDGTNTYSLEEVLAIEKGILSIAND